MFNLSYKLIWRFKECSEWTVKFKVLRNSRLISILKLWRNNNNNDVIEFQLKYWKNLFINTTLKTLTKKQKIILLEVYALCKGEKFTLTKLSKVISRRLKIPESTAKWNLRVLRDLGLIEAGNSQINRLPIHLTRAGLAVVKALGIFLFFIKYHHLN